MKYIFLLRHGHAPRIGTETDKDRQLSSLGLKEIGEVATFLKEREYPEIIIASDAVRTRQSAEQFCRAVGYKPMCRFTSELYNCSSDDIIHVIESCENSYDRLMIVGHNPGITGVIDYFPNARSERSLEVNSRNYDPTAKLVLLKANLLSWQELPKAKWEIDAVFWPGL